MLLNSLELLANQNPKYRQALRSLGSWLNSHADARVINPMVVARDLRELDPTTLAMAFTLLVQAGLLTRVYKVLTPAGVIADEEFEDPTLIPEKLADRFEQYFDTADADVIPVFRRVA